MTTSSRRGTPGLSKGKSYVPQRGDIVWIDYNPQRGREQAKRRPALVLSPADYNGLVGLAVVCPIANQARDYPFEVMIPPGLAATGVVLADQIKSFDWHQRNAEFKGKFPESVVREVLETVLTLLDPRDEDEEMVAEADG